MSKLEIPVGPIEGSVLEGPCRVLDEGHTEYTFMKLRMSDGNYVTVEYDHTKETLSPETLVALAELDRRRNKTAPPLATKATIYGTGIVSSYIAGGQTKPSVKMLLMLEEVAVNEKASDLPVDGLNLPKASQYGSYTPTVQQEALKFLTQTIGVNKQGQKLSEPVRTAMSTLATEGDNSKDEPPRPKKQKRVVEQTFEEVGNEGVNITKTTTTTTEVTGGATAIRPNGSPGTPLPRGGTAVTNARELNQGASSVVSVPKYSSKATGALPQTGAQGKATKFNNDVDMTTAGP